MKVDKGAVAAAAAENLKALQLAPIGDDDEEESDGRDDIKSVITFAQSQNSASLPSQSVSTSKPFGGRPNSMAMRRSSFNSSGMDSFQSSGTRPVSADIRAAKPPPPPHPGETFGRLTFDLRTSYHIVCVAATGRSSEDSKTPFVQRTVSTVAKESAADLVSTMNALALEQTGHDPTDPPGYYAESQTHYEQDGYYDGAIDEYGQPQEYYDANGNPQHSYGEEYNAHPTNDGWVSTCSHDAVLCVVCCFQTASLILSSLIVPLLSQIVLR